MALGIITGLTLAGSDVALLARLRGSTGQLVTPASLASIAWTLTDLTAGQQVATGTLTPASVVFSSLVQNDPRWTRDSAAAPGPDGQWGYNFAAVIPAANFALSSAAAGLGPSSAHQFQVDVRFQGTAGGVWRVSWQVIPQQVYG